MLIDRVRLKICAGSGGRGIIAWRREKYIPKGGPAGGDGGKGGDVIILVDPNVCGLDYFRHLKVIQAKNGEKGQGKGCKGADGENITLRIPPGTVVKDMNTGEILFDGVSHNDTFLLCQGGKGGLGNVHFKTPSNRAPNIATPGEEGEQKEIEFELKLIGDVGLVGFPNAGKSTLLTKLTYTQVAIAPYPFTTLSPNLGFISYEGGSRILLTDIPGIIEGAHQNRGLGFAFLRHIERTKVLLYVLDAAGIDGRDPLSDYKTLVDELSLYDPLLLKRPSGIVLNKCDLPESLEMVAKFRKKISHPHIIEVSAETEEHLDQLKHLIKILMEEAS